MPILFLSLFLKHRHQIPNQTGFFYNLAGNPSHEKNHLNPPSNLNFSSDRARAKSEQTK
jgi:hypothetical protein